MSAPRPPLDRGAAVAGALTVLLANALYLSGLGEILDPMMSMEPFYIQTARQPAAAILAGDPSWGPLYALWFKPLVALFREPIAVYAANVVLQSIALSSLIYLHVLLLTGRAAPATAAALIFLIGDFNVPLAGKVSSFALMLALAGLTAAQLARPGARRMAVAAGGVLLASYVRPEFYPAALALTAVAGWRAWRESAVDRAATGWPAALLLAIVAAAVALGTPLSGSGDGGDRLLTAFREHFAWNWGWWNNDWVYYLDAWERTFGTGANSIAAAFAANPGAFLHHLAYNLIGSARLLVGAAFGHYPVLVPATRPLLVQAESLALSLTVIGAVVWVAARAATRRELLARHGDVLLVYAALSACALASAVLVYPVARYLATPSVCLLLTGALAATVLVPPAPPLAWSRRLLAMLICLAVVPRPFVLPSAYDVPDSPFKGRIAVSRPITDTVAFVRALPIPAPVDVLTMTDGIGEMLGDGFREVKIWQRGNRPLRDYVREERIDVIVSMEPGHHSFFIQDPYFKLLQTDPDRTDFVRYAVPGHDHISVFVRRDLVR